MPAMVSDMEGFSSRGNHRSHGGTPGGGSTIVFGDEYSSIPTPKKLASSTVGARGDSESQGDTLPVLKLRAIQGIANAETAEQLEQSLRLFLADLSIHTEDNVNETAPSFPEGTGRVTGSIEDAPRAPSGAPATTKVSETLQKLKTILRKRGCNGIISLGIRFRAMDDDGNKKLCFQEFKKGLEEVGMNEEEAKDLFRYFDKDLSGSIEFDELLEGIAPPPNARRRGLIMEAFKIFDLDGSGEITVQDLMGRYDASQHPDVGAGKRTTQQILRELLDAFDEGEKDGIVTMDEFLHYYQRVGASIDDDDYFELMIRNAWHISGGSGWCQNTTCRRVLVTHADGHQSVEEITDDMDIGQHDNAAMMANIRSRGIDAVSIAVTGAPAESTKADATSGLMTPGSASRPGTARSKGTPAYLQSSIQF